MIENIFYSEVKMNFSNRTDIIRIIPILRSRPGAAAEIAGGEMYPDISGVLRLYQTGAGVIVYAEISGLPTAELPCTERIFGFHIHDGERCGGGGAPDPFADALSHYNPDGCAHPFHAGDLPPLFGNAGFALSVFLTDRFSVAEVIGKTVVIHDSPDDFTSQPAGNSGARIACGVIRGVGRRMI